MCNVGFFCMCIKENEFLKIKNIEIDDKTKQN